MDDTEPDAASIARKAPALGRSGSATPTEWRTAAAPTPARSDRPVLAADGGRVRRAVMVAIAVLLRPARGSCTPTRHPPVARRLRTHWLTNIMLAVNWLTSRWVIRPLRWGTIARARRVPSLASPVRLHRQRSPCSRSFTYNDLAPVRAPPAADVTILAPLERLRAAAAPGRRAGGHDARDGICARRARAVRDAAKLAIGVVLFVVCFARMYLGVDWPSALARVRRHPGFRLRPDLVPMVRPQRRLPRLLRARQAAHLDVTGARGDAIVGRRSGPARAGGDRDQAGRARGSGGSTPLRLTVAATEDEPQRYVFAKLYAKSHVRADRWYKLGRTILYGALEDETPFKSVRRFVEYEDYTLRLMYDAGLPAPEPFGFVEITPEREYMIVMQFFDDAVEISEADVDDTVIDEGLDLVRRMWDLGLAHRDVKPANLMVQAGELRLIDVFFVQVRPSPWRQAVDLANMMMVLALRTDAPRVYEHALQRFSPDEIAEAFAATRGVASPTQLRSMMKAQGRDLLAEFRALAPARAPIKIQRWSVRRIALTHGCSLGAFFAVTFVVGQLDGVHVKRTLAARSRPRSLVAATHALAAREQSNPPPCRAR